MGFLKQILHNIKNIKRANSIRAMGKEALLAMEDEAFYDAMVCVTFDAVFDIHAKGLSQELINVYSLIQLEQEVNNGGLCQFFVNSSRECAPFVSDALHAVGAEPLKDLYDSFVQENKIDVNDLSSFRIRSVEDYQAQTKRYDFDSFDDQFYAYTPLHQKIIDYARMHVELMIKE